MGSKMVPINAKDRFADLKTLQPSARSQMPVEFQARILASRCRSFPVSIRINHVANHDEECSAPVELAQIQSRLFL